MQTSKTIAAALNSPVRVGSSYAALHRQEQTGHREGNTERVLALWRYLAAQGFAPCSTKTAAEHATRLKGEHYFTARSTNYDTVRKRTADAMLLTPCPLRCMKSEDYPLQSDPDGVRRDWYEVVA